MTPPFTRVAFASPAYRVSIALANSFEHFHACAHDIGTVGLGQLDAHDEKGKQDTRGALNARLLVGLDLVHGGQDVSLSGLEVHARIGLDQLKGLAGYDSR